MRMRILGIVVVMACSVGGYAASATNLKPIEPLALQGAVEAMGKEFMLPGAMFACGSKGDVLAPKY